MTEPVTHVFKLLTASDWDEAEARGTTAVEIDLRDGYVHLSSPQQVAETARLHFSGKGRVHLVRFVVDELPPLVWEPSRGGQLFPHLYAPLEVSLADVRWTIEPDADGAIVIPAEALRP